MRAVEFEMSINISGSLLVASLALISHNASANGCDAAYAATRCQASIHDSRWAEITGSGSHQWTNMPAALAASWVLATRYGSSANALLLSCPALSPIASAFDEFRRGARSCHSHDDVEMFASATSPIHSNALANCEINFGRGLGAACTRELVDEWWDEAPRATLDF
jgi:hypothetical protein